MNDPFYDIVATLMANEFKALKSTFKKSGNAEAVTLKVCEIVRKHKVTNDTELIACLPQHLEKMGTLRKAKNNWYNSVLNAMGRSQANDNPVQQYINKIQFLASKYLYTHAEKLFDPALKLAKELELFNEGIKLCDQIRHIYWINRGLGFPMKKNNADFVIPLRESFISIQSNHHLVQRVVDEAAKQVNGSSDADQILKGPDLPESTRAAMAIELYFYRKCRDGGNFQAMAESLARFIKLIDTHLALLQDPVVIDQYIIAVYEYGMSQRVLNNWEGSKQAQQKLTALQTRYKKAEIMTLPHILLLNVDYATYTFDHNAGPGLLERYEKLKAILGDRFSPIFEVKLLYKIGFYLLYAAQPKKAIPVLKNLVNYSNPAARPDLQSVGRLLMLLALYDTHDFEAVLHIQKASINGMKKLNRYRDYEKMILDMLMLLAKGENVKDLRTDFIDSLTTYFSVPENKYNENYFDFVAWLSAANKGLTIMQWLKSQK